MSQHRSGTCFTIIIPCSDAHGMNITYQDRTWHIISVLSTTYTALLQWTQTLRGSTLFLKFESSWRHSRSWSTTHCTSEYQQVNKTNHTFIYFRNFIFILPSRKHDIFIFVQEPGHALTTFASGVSIAAHPRKKHWIAQYLQTSRLTMWPFLSPCLLKIKCQPPRTNSPWQEIGYFLTFSRIIKPDAIDLLSCVSIQQIWWLHLVLKIAQEIFDQIIWHRPPHTCIRK